MWSAIKTIFFGLLDMVVLLFLIRLLFRTPANFFKAFWRAGRPAGFTFLTLRNRDGEPSKNLEVYATIMALALLIWAEKSLCY